MFGKNQSSSIVAANVHIVVYSCSECAHCGLQLQ